MAKTKKTEETEEKKTKLEASEEKESGSSAEEKKAKLLERAKKLEAGVKEETVETEKLKEKVKAKAGEEEKKELMVPIEDYLKSSIYLGTRVMTPDMKPFVYRRRADGLAVFNTNLLDDKIKEAALFLSKFAPEDIIVVCKREAGWKAVVKFADTLGIKYYTKKYPAGILTNTNLETFREAKLVFICDPWLDKNAAADAKKVHIPVMSICDTNNYIKKIDQIVPGNNKSAKSLGMIFFLLTKLYIENRKIDVKAPAIQEFVDDWDNLQPPQ